MQADLSRYDTDVANEDALLQRPSKPTDHSLGQLKDEADDIDDDAMNQIENPDYQEQAASLEKEYFQMNLDDLNWSTQIEFS